jgi:hypothetical protein
MVILSPLAGNTGSFVKDSEHFIRSVQDINLQNRDYLVIFDVVSLFTSVPVEVLQFIRKRPSMILLSQNAHLYTLKMS